ncbi:hypothetical protein LWI28_024976 [Acer negundo]|uniref:Uncharacterized protein n=1 Tax=Acer negundo TaxID=4023 RepID=A0AAD5J6Q1_ACENE|nr:hypothetical protein LWI28_024976 [Acer negundo]
MLFSCGVLLKRATARPYICDTSYRHPNCLDQFKTLASTPSNETVQENPPTSINPSITKEEASLPGQSKHGMILLPPNLSCPLCQRELLWVHCSRERPSVYEF